MDLPKLYEQMETLLARLGVQVRTEPFDPKVFNELSARGGYCTLRGDYVVLVDAHAPLVDRATILACVLADFDLDAVFMAPQVRQYIEAHMPPDGGRKLQPPRAVPRYRVIPGGSA